MLPNNLPYTKEEYLKRLSRTFKDYNITDFAVAFYHCEMPINLAEDYILIVYKKLLERDRSTDHAKNR